MERHDRFDTSPKRRGDWPRRLCRRGRARSASSSSRALRRTDGRWLRAHAGRTSPHLALAADYAWLVDVLHPPLRGDRRGRWLEHATAGRRRLDRALRRRGRRLLHDRADADRAHRAPRRSYDGVDARRQLGRRQRARPPRRADRRSALSSSAPRRSSRRVRGGSPTSPIAFSHLLVNAAARPTAGPLEVVDRRRRPDLAALVQERYLPDGCSPGASRHRSPLWETDPTAWPTSVGVANCLRRSTTSTSWSGRSTPRRRSRREATAADARRRPRGSAEDRKPGNRARMRRRASCDAVLLVVLATVRGVDRRSTLVREPSCGHRAPPGPGVRRECLDQVGCGVRALDDSRRSRRATRSGTPGSRAACRPRSTVAGPATRDRAGDVGCLDASASPTVRQQPLLGDPWPLARLRRPRRARASVGGADPRSVASLELRRQGAEDTLHRLGDLRRA